MEYKPSFIQYVLLKGIPFGIFFGAGVTIICGAVWGYPLHSVPLLVGITAGLFSGSFFGIAVAMFATSSTVQQQTKKEFTLGEEIFYSGPANHFKKIEARGGKLYLTNQSLLFKPYKTNLQTDELVIPLNEIDRAKTAWTFCLIPNGLLVFLNDGSKHIFAVHRREKWCKAISTNLKS